MRAGARTRKQPEVRSAEWVDRSPICIRDQEVTVMHIIIVLDEGEADCLPSAIPGESLASKRFITGMRMSWRWTPTDRNVAIESDDVQAHEMFAYARFAVAERYWQD